MIVITVKRVFLKQTGNVTLERLAVDNDVTKETDISINIYKNTPFRV